MTIKEKEKLQVLILEASKDLYLLDFIKRTEKKFSTTQNNYGEYMNFLSNFLDNGIVFYIISEALIIAGGNIKGIKSAIQVLKG